MSGVISPSPDEDRPDRIPTIWGRRESAVAAYRKLGWPLQLSGPTMSLALGPLDAVALVIPVVLGTTVAELLIRRHCAPSVLTHPALPEHRIILASEPYPVPLGWPTGVNRVTGTVALPPTATADGPVRWVHPPQPNALRLCREFDVFAALHTSLRDPAPASVPVSVDPPAP